MGFQKQTLLAGFFALAVLTAPLSAAHASYTYLHNEGEYSIELPDAPVGRTIWADQKEPIPFLEEPGKFGSLGEIATMRRTDPDTGDYFDVEITFLKADRPFLLSLTEEKLTGFLKDAMKDTRLEAQKINYSAGSDSLKWATMTGFSVDDKNTLLYNATHLVTGFETITLIKIKYTAENRSYSAMFKDLQSSIKFTGK